MAKLTNITVAKLLQYSVGSPFATQEVHRLAKASINSKQGQINELFEATSSCLLWLVAQD